MVHRPRLGCERLFTAEGAKFVQKTVQAATGEPCPCKRGDVCPLLTRKDLAEVR